jgi:mannose-6-phosphate isomerase-like protein (cupin superfamily)
MKMSNINEAVVQHHWANRGFSCGIWTDPPGQVWADYVHETDELVMLIEGQIELTFNGKTFQPNVGEEVLIPAGIYHTVVNIGQSPNRWFYGYKRR